MKCIIFRNKIRCTFIIIIITTKEKETRSSELYSIDTNQQPHSHILPYDLWLQMQGTIMHSYIMWIQLGEDERTSK